MVQIDESEWDEVASPEYLAILPFYPEDLTKKYKFSFFEYLDDGLGLAKSCILQIDEFKYWLCAHPDGPDVAKYVGVEARSFESNLKVALDKLLRSLDIKESDLIDMREDIGPANWVLYRIDDNGNEIEMYRFHREEFAYYLAQKYESKGHKQTYIVTDVTSLSS